MPAAAATTNSWRRPSSPTDPLQAGGLQARPRHHPGAGDRRGDPRRHALGIQWLLKNHRDLIDAEFALNEGGGVGLKDGKADPQQVQTTEKVSVSYRLDVKNTGGHSSLPCKDNAIYRLAEGLVRLSKFSFPLNFNETTRAYFERVAQFESEQTAADIRAVLSDKPIPPRCRSRGCRQPVSTRNCAPPASPPCWRVATPTTRCRTGQRKVNCRIMPGEPAEEVKATLERVLADDQITVTQLDQPMLSAPSALHEEIIGQIEKLSAGILARCGGAADDERRRDRRQLPAQCRHPHLRPFGARRRPHDFRAHGKDERMLRNPFSTATNISIGW